MSDQVIVQEVIIFKSNRLYQTIKKKKTALLKKGFTNIFKIKTERTREKITAKKRMTKYKLPIKCIHIKYLFFYNNYKINRFNSTLNRKITILICSDILSSSICLLMITNILFLFLLFFLFFVVFC